MKQNTDEANIELCNTYHFYRIRLFFSQMVTCITIQFGMEIFQHLKCLYSYL